MNNKTKRNTKHAYIYTLIVMLAIACTVVLTGCQSIEGGDNEQAAFKSYVTGITSQVQQSNGVAITNYQVVVSSDADWANMNDEKRKEITDQAIIECRAMADANNINNYNVIGTVDNEGTAFLYDRSNEQVIIYAKGTPTGTTISAPAR